MAYLDEVLFIRTTIIRMDMSRSYIIIIIIISERLIAVKKHAY